MIVADVEEILKSSGVPLVADFKEKLEEALLAASSSVDPNAAGDPSNPDDPNYDPFADPSVDPLTGKQLTLANESGFDDDDHDNPLRLLSSKKKIVA